ncbi:hypothetical protein [Aeoliella mucimassa]|uniref:Esterase PHB depolymerase n=1 Tax=Aeoliella mucimassa TaxID=2527972 RepID=A0A518AHY4_9BACT|nr:hypothetical protein [Aeoliella mucimassa]QDU54341.1 Esterase PHB depolymerase [Aeoliella mucimassa]
MTRLATLTLVLLLFIAVSPTQAALTPDQLEAAKAWLEKPADERPAVDSLDLPSDLSKEDAAQVTEQLWKLMQETDPVEGSALGPLPKSVQESIKDGKLELHASTLPLGEHTMPFVVLRREQQPAPEAGRPLFLCFHGGGAKPDADGPHSWAINTRELQAQVQLSLGVYPSEGIYWIPRMADDRLGRWWHYHNQVAIDAVIDHAVLHWGVDPNRVYILGISEGGYGTDILAPYMPDRFAGAAAMAAGVGLGNPVANLRNVAFSTDVGEKDTMFDRRPLAEKFHAALDDLHEEDPEGYVHRLDVQAGRGHGVDYSQGTGWIPKYTRKPFPNKFVWIDQPLDNHRRSRMYWVNYPESEQEGLNRIVGTADSEANRIELKAEKLSEKVAEGHPTHIDPPEGEIKPLSGAKLTLLLSDELVNLDKPVEVVVNGKSQTVEPSRSAGAILATLADRPDPTMAATCEVEVTVD